MYINFCLQVHVQVSALCSLILCPLFATGVNDTGGKFVAGVLDTGGKFAAGVVDTGGNLPPVSLTPVVNLNNNNLDITVRHISYYYITAVHSL